MRPVYDRRSDAGRAGQCPVEGIDVPHLNRFTQILGLVRDFFIRGTVRRAQARRTADSLIGFAYRGFTLFYGARGEVVVSPCVVSNCVAGVLNVVDEVRVSLSCAADYKECGARVVLFQDAQNFWRGAVIGSVVEG